VNRPYEIVQQGELEIFLVTPLAPYHATLTNDNYFGPGRRSLFHRLLRAKTTGSRGLEIDPDRVLETMLFASGVDAPTEREKYRK
jgi:hypothetical protein